MLFDPLGTNLLSTHWTVVLIVGLLFFSLQFALSLRISSSLRRQERLLLRLCRDHSEGGDGRPATDALPEAFTWLRWVLTIFPVGAATPPGSYTRDSVIQELDTRLASDSRYLLLQRMGVMAPLVGVILTVAGFWYLRVEDSGDMRLQDILFAVTPLVSGVGAGAVLALINQALLQWTGQRIESLRMAARTWFDLAIWSSVGLDSQAATVNAVGAVERMAAAISQAADRHTESASRMTTSTSAIHDSAREFCGVVRDFGGQIQGVPQTLGDLTSAIKASSTALESLVQVGSRAVAGLDVSVAAFRTTVDNEFAEVARQQQLSAQHLADAVRHVGTTTEFLMRSAHDLKETIDSSNASFRSLKQALETNLLPGQQQFQAMVGQLSNRLEAFTVHLESLVGQVSTTAGEFHTGFACFAPAVSAFRSAVEHEFAPAATRHNKQVAVVSEAVEKLQESASRLSHSTAAVQSVSQQHGESTDTAARTQHTLAGAVESLAAVAAQLQTMVERHLAPSNRVFQGAAASFAKSAMQFSSLTNGELEQLTSRLTELNDTLSRLEETFASIQRFSRVSGDIDRLAESLLRVADVTDAIASLPDGVRRILGQTIADAESHTKTRDRIMNWFSRSPR
jgi:methyl-accepting chemotaxis protein